MIDRRTLMSLPPAMMLAAAADAAGKSAPANLRWDGKHLFLRVRVNGRPAEALLDPKVGTTLIDRRHAGALGIDAGQSSAARATIEAGGRTLGPLPVTLTDLTDYANFMLRGRIAMVLGRDLFATIPLLLDLGALTLTPLGPRAARGGRALPVTRRAGYDTVPVTIDGMPAAAALSLRDLDTLIVSAAFAGRTNLGRSGPVSGPGPGPGRAAGMMQQAGTAIRRLDVAGQSFRDISAALSGSTAGPDLWIGPPILRRFRLGLDLPAGLIWFEPRPRLP